MYFDDESNTKYAVFRILSREVMDNNIFSFYKKKKIIIISLQWCIDRNTAEDFTHCVIIILNHIHFIYVCVLVLQFWCRQNHSLMILYTSEPL